AITEWRKRYPTFPDDWSYSTFLYEINCKDRTFTVLQRIIYNAKNEIINATSIEHPLLDYISPESMMEGLYKIVCVKKDLKDKAR
ncbi:MAG: surface-adhesin E family protein, partial [Syntrophales bacterium]